MVTMARVGAKQILIIYLIRYLKKIHKVSIIAILIAFGENTKDLGANFMDCLLNLLFENKN